MEIPEAWFPVQPSSRSAQLVCLTSMSQLAQKCPSAAMVPPSWSWKLGHFIAHSLKGLWEPALSVELSPVMEMFCIFPVNMVTTGHLWQWNHEMWPGGLSSCILKL